MIDIKLLRENPEKVKIGARNKGANIDIDKILELDKTRRAFISQIEVMRAEQKKFGKEQIEKAKELKIKIKELEPQLENAEKEFNELFVKIPNLPLDSVPVGKDESENKVIKEFGKKPKIAKPLDYMVLAEKLGIIVYDELWQKINGAPQNIVHILKHEIAHGLSHWAEVGRDTETQAKLDEMIADTDGLKSRESYRSVNAINQFLDKKQDAQWLSKEILAEKIAAYLESAGNFGSFIEAQLLATPWENVKIIFDAKNSEVQDRWLAENRAIFDQIDAQMRDKDSLKEKILASTEEQRAEIESHYDDDDFDWDYFLGGGISEPGIPDNTKSPEYRAGGESMLADLARLADAVGSEVEKALPITELKKAA